MLQLIHSNRLEILAQRFCSWLAGGAADPLLGERVVVPHPGVGRWLALQTADRLGICANIRFVQPAGFVWEMLACLLGDLPPQELFQPKGMQWLLYRRFQEMPPERQPEPLRRYLADADAVNRFELAGELARCFDQYLVYRPEWILSWERGESALPGDEWQAELWRTLSPPGGAEHWAGLRLRLAQALRSGSLQPENLPERAALFAVGSLSPGYLEILQQLAGWMELRLFLLNPCEEEWFNLVSPAERERREEAGDGSELYLEVGNPLVASLGRQGGEFFAQLLEYDSGAEEAFVAPAGDLMLHRLQRDILWLREIDGEAAEAVERDDRSIRFHSCHGPMREVEVLHDQLLALFDEMPGLEPDDVLVMTPDMDSYGPYIEAVFGEAAEERRIPYSLADRQTLARHPLVTGLLRLLETPQSRYEVNSLISLLEIPALGRRFGIRPEEMPLISAWLDACNVRWGRDASTRAALGQPATGRNSWQEGLDRMLLGYALPGNGADLFAGILPFDEVEGAAAQLLGGLQEFLCALEELGEGLREARSPARWGETVTALCNRFFAEGEESAEALQAVRDALAELVREAQAVGFRLPVERQLLRSELQRRLEGVGTGGGFLSGGVTFCALAPLRSLPFRVICMIGLNGDSFPRDRRPPGFDLMAGNRRPGDRSRRADDRYLFLESLVSARERLYLSYVGQDLRDNAPLPPSVLVSELLDYLDRRFAGPDGERAAELLLTRHPLQPFNPAYFAPDSGLFSYVQANCEGARRLLAPRTPSPGFFPVPLPEPDEGWREVTLDRLVEFYGNPARYLLARRLGIRFERSEGLLESRDPFGLDNLVQRDLKRRLLDAEMAGISADQSYRLEQARGVLPHGAAGERLFEALHAGVRQLWREERSLPAGEPLPDLPVDFRHGAMHLAGRLSGVTSLGIQGCSSDRLSSAALFALWVRHLALNLLPPAGGEAASRWHGPEGTIHLPPCAEAPSLLGELLDCYWAGLQEPLRFFPKSSRAYAAAILRGRERDQALRAATSAWSSEFTYAEGADPYYRRAFTGIDPMGGDFEDLSRRLYEPLLRSMEVA